MQHQAERSAAAAVLAGRSKPCDVRIAMQLLEHQRGW